VRREFELNFGGICSWCPLEETSGQRRARILQWETFGQRASRWHSTPRRTLPAPRGMLTNTQPSPWFCPSGRQPGSYRETGFEEMRTQPTLDSRTPRRSGLLGVSRLHCPL